MSSASAQQLQRMNRPVEKLKKPRPLKIQNQNRHSTIDARLSTLEEVMLLAETVGSSITNKNCDKNLLQNIIQLNGLLKSYGSKLEAVYKDQLDRVFVTFRNGSRDDSLDYLSRLHLLELIELRAMQWVPNDSNYYKHKYSQQDIESVHQNALENSMSSPNIFQLQNTQVLNTLGPLSPPTPLLLAPGELVKPSGKYTAPTKISGSKQTALLHSFSTSDANLGEYKYTVTVGDDSIKITGTNLDLVRTAKLLLDEHFGTECNEQLNDYGYDEENEIFEPAMKAPESILRVNSQDSEESEDTFKVQQTKMPSEIMKSTSFKNFPSMESKNEIELNEADDGSVFDEVPSLSAEEFKLLTESAEYYQRKKNVVRVTSQSNEQPSLKTYTCEEIIHFADSPLSHRTPKDWISVVMDFPLICKKVDKPYSDFLKYTEKYLINRCRCPANLGHSPDKPKYW